MIRFGDYQLDPVQGLSKGADEVRVTPRSLAVLRVLAERAGQVVTKEELFREVWVDTAVSDAALTSCIQELRRVLGDDARHPRFIETLHRRGYRFLPRLTRDAAARTSTVAPPGGGDTPSGVVGREPVIGRLVEAAARAEAGTRQIVFLTGEPGVGKTTVVQALLGRTAGRGVLSAWAQCVEHYGVGEPYQPVLEALTRLCRHERGDGIIALLERHAPTWLAQLPGLLPPARLASLQRSAAGTTRDRMLRELTGAIEAISADTPLVLWLDDLHWCDASTLDWMGGFAQRPETARVLLVGSYRQSGLWDRQQPLAVVTESLRVKGFCRELPLGGLDAAAVTELVAARFPPEPGQERAFERLARMVGDHTAGNPLFLINVLGDLAARDILRRDRAGWRIVSDLATLDLGIPEDVQRVIQRQMDRLAPDDRALLEVAAVAGAAFSTAAVAAAAQRDASTIEMSFAGLAEQTRFVRETGVTSWPDGTLSTRFEFVHALYREVLYRGVPAGRRAEWHLAVGMREEAACGDRAPEAAAELAMHFERGRDRARAVVYLHHAADNARRRCAYVQARAHFERALTLLASEPPGVGRAERQVVSWIGIGSAVMATEGWGSAGAERAFSQARALCESLGDTTRLFPALWGLWLFYWGRSQVAAAHEIATGLLDTARRLDDSALLLQAHHAMWATAFSQGRLEETLSHADEGIRLYDAARHAGMTATYGSHDAGLCARQFKARALALAGRSAESAVTTELAVRMARDLGHPFSEALAEVFAAAVHQTLRDGPQVSRHAAAALRIAREHDFRLLHAWAAVLDGWAMVDAGRLDDGLREIANGVTAARATGSGTFVPYLLGLLSEACLKLGRLAQAAATLDEARAITEATGERFYQAEILRLKGEVAMAGADAQPGAAEGFFSAAADMARAQGARLLAYRAAIGLGGLLCRAGRLGDAHVLIARAADELGETPPPADAADAARLVQSI